MYRLNCCLAVAVVGLGGSAVAGVITVAPATRAELSGDRRGELPTTSCSGDSNHDGVVGAVDLEELLNRWGRVPTTAIVPYGNLNASGVVATTGSVHNARAFFTDALLTPGTEMVGTEGLTVLGTDLYISDGAGGTFLALEGGRQAILTVSNLEKGGKDLGTMTFGFMTAAQATANNVDAFGSNMNDYNNFLESVLGLDSTVISGQTLGGQVRISTGVVGDPPSGTTIIEGNEGTVQDLEIDTSDLVVTYADPLAAGINQPFVMTKAGSADGESIRTVFRLYDSFCVPVSVSLTLVLQQASEFGSTAIWLAESNDVNALDRIVGLGVLEFDARGMLTDATNDLISVDRDNGAVSPFLAIIGFISPIGGVTAVSNSPSKLFAIPNPFLGFEADLNGDGVVNVPDLLILLANWG